jgi:hypothetical protein
MFSGIGILLSVSIIRGLSEPAIMTPHVLDG